MTARKGHNGRSQLENAVCVEMDRQGVAHEHRSLRFRVADEHEGLSTYEPAIVARRGSILFLVEPVPSLDGGAVERLSRFLEQHSPEIVLVVVTPDSIGDQVPPEAYDEIYVKTEIAKLAQRIQEQDPEGIVRPFPKPRRSRDTAK